MSERTTRVLIATCITAAIAGCAMPRGGESGGAQVESRGQTRHNDQECAPAAQTCNIDIRIRLTAHGWLGVVDPKVLVVYRGDGSPKTIHWKLTGASEGYEFKDQKVIVGESAFDCEQPGQHKKEIMCKDTFAGTKTDFQYDLHIVKASDGSELTIDPWIVNR